MPSVISASDVKNIHIYNGDRNPHELGLCRRHRSELSHMLTEKLDGLVATKLFQSQFKEFLPDPESQKNVNVKIHIKDREISVQKLDERGKGTGNTKKIHLDQVQVDRTEIEEAEAVNQSILEHANKIYQDHLNESKPRRRHAPSLHRRTSYYEPRRSYRHKRGRSRSPREERSRSIERPAHHHHDRDRSVSVERGRSPSPERHEHRREHHRHAYPHSASPTLMHRYPGLSFETELHRKKGEKSVPAKQPVHNPENPHTSRKKTHAHPNPQSKSAPQIETATPPKPNPEPTSTPRRIVISPRLPKRQNPVPDSAAPKKPRVPVEPSARIEPVSEIHLPLSELYVGSDDYDRLIRLSRALNEPNTWASERLPGQLEEEFKKLPETIRHAIYHQTYLLVDPTEYDEPWPIGEELFLGKKRAQNRSRAHAIEHFLFHTLSSDFAHAEDEKVPPPELLRRFGQFSEGDQSAVHTQLAFIQPKGPDYQGPAHAFAGGDRLSCSNKERCRAIQRVYADKIVEYHRLHYRKGIKFIEETYQKELERRIGKASAL